MNPIAAFIENLRCDADGNPVIEKAETQNLRLAKAEFVARMLKENGGQALLDLLQDGESAICERLGLIHGYFAEGDIYFDVPRWNNLVCHLRMVNDCPEPTD